MADRAREQRSIKASLAACIDAITDFERYPLWASDIKAVRILSTDAEGRASSVEYRVGAMGRSTRVVLKYDYSDLPDLLSWKLIDGDSVRAFDGTYTFTERGPDHTDVHYEIAVDLVMPIPRFIKRRAERIVRRSAMDELKSYLENRS